MTFLKHNKAGLCLLIMGMILITVGVMRGEAETVFRRAVNVCMECIGLG